MANFSIGQHVYVRRAFVGRDTNGRGRARFQHDEHTGPATIVSVLNSKDGTNYKIARGHVQPDDDWSAIIHESRITAEKCAHTEDPCACELRGLALYR